ncbi:MAG: SMI1/KNR4 family protein [candidate division KSB1 bacterium]|nr:SMI1/KNR4 family protein [candidate division KSB1 bacterium]
MKREIENRFPLLGGIVPIGNTFVPVSEEELHSIETALGVALPNDYREFVQKYGASAFGESVQFRLMQADPVHPVESLLGTPITRYEEGPLSAFYGGKEAGTYSLAKEIAVYEGRMPDTMIPIADDGGGNQICLGIKGKERGKVYYWDHHNEWDEQDYLEDYGEPMPPEAKFQNVYLIAESFEDFIRRLEKTASA